ncbi:hypothetical protein [Gallionella capsiferriformans]|uniref:Uncharacterized protein n=1 Tax=Gallionella capsiferriformans (strain ES-2) TaxID=395494 RepID=D9SD43_GALCS|nr:hypothetical protein [Gallionella capsiferriformans]ADL54732.1 hypothetical protein Galf_0692 [Gallionella capsiferriformans ES-2]
MKFNARHIKYCKEEGFVKAWIKDGDLYADLDQEGTITMLVEPNGAARMLLGPSGMKSPAHITVPLSKKENHVRVPARFFKSVKKAAAAAATRNYY